MASLSAFIFNTRPERFFLAVASCFGILFLLATPPFQVPDEMNHFYKAYQISEGKFISVKQDQRVGGTVPASLEEVLMPFVYMCWDIKTKTSHVIIEETLKRPLKSEVTNFMDFPNTAMYSPVCYAPQAVAIFILRLFNAPPLVIFYGARLLALCCWLFGMYAAIRLIPVYKWLFAFVALLPMSVFINMSLSADVATNIVTFLFIAITLKYAYDDLPISRKRLIVLCLMAFLVVSVKLVYMPILLTVLIIPAAKFQSLRHRLLSLAGIAAISLATAALWSSMMSGLYTPYADYNVKYRDNPAMVNTAHMGQQMDYIVSHGTYIFNVFGNSLKSTFYMYSQGYIGTFGWLEVKLPLWIIKLMYAILLLVLVLGGDKAVKIGIVPRLVLALGFLLSLGFMLLSQHLTWDPVGGDCIYTIQGRYLIPFMPLLFLLFHNRIAAKKIAIPLVMVFSIFGLAVSFYFINHRYFSW